MVPQFLITEKPRSFGWQCLCLESFHSKGCSDSPLQGAVLVFLRGCAWASVFLSPLGGATGAEQTLGENTFKPHIWLAFMFTVCCSSHSCGWIPRRSLGRIIYFSSQLWVFSPLYGKMGRSPHVTHKTGVMRPGMGRELRRLDVTFKGMSQMTCVFQRGPQLLKFQQSPKIVPSFQNMRSEEHFVAKMQNRCAYT